MDRANNLTTYLTDHPTIRERSNGNQLPLFAFRTAIVLAITCCSVASFVVGNNQQEILVGLAGTTILMIVSIPLFTRRDYSLFEPATFVILLVLFGTPLKLLYVIASYSEDKHVAQILLNFEQPEYFIPALGIVAIGWVCFVLGYSLRPFKSPLENIFLAHRNQWNGHHLRLVVTFIIIVSATCLVGFIVSAGVRFGSLSEMSTKRFSEEAGSSAARIHQVKYYLYRGAAISKFLVYFGLIWTIARNKPFLSWTGILIVFALCQTIFLAFVMSSRSSVLLILIDCMVIFFYMKDTINVRTLLLAATIGSALLLPMLAGRAKEENALSRLVQKTLAGRDMLDITKTCHIINGVPSKMDHCHGETIFGWLAAPIPKSLWESKPMWAGKGPYINQHIFSDRLGISGVPPGYIAELYWNFGWTGVFSGMLLMGIALRHFFDSFKPHIGNPSSVLIYTIIATRFGMFALGNDLGTGVIKTALDVVPVILILLFIGFSGSDEQLTRDEYENLEDSRYSEIPF